MDIPRITYYAKVIDNLTGVDITNYKNAMDDINWYYGKIDSNLGGESQYIIEFDIWNNEPAFNARTYDVFCKDAHNVKLNIEINKEKSNNDENYNNTLNDISFLYGRNLTDNLEEFKLIDKEHPLLIYGNLNPNKKILSGKGDHCIVQTKLIMPKNTILTKQRFNFNLTLTYDFE